MPFLKATIMGAAVAGPVFASSELSPRSSPSVVAGGEGKGTVSYFCWCFPFSKVHIHQTMHNKMSQGIRVHV